MSSVRRISGTTKPYCRANLRRILAIREAISSRERTSAALSSFDEAELDLDDLQLLLDRGALLGLGLRVLRRLPRLLLGAVLGEAAGNGEADEGHQAAEHRERQERQARERRRARAIRSAARKSAFG